MGLKGPEIQILSDTIRAMNLRLGIFKEPISCLGIWDSLRERLESEYDDIQEILKTGFCDMIDVLSGADAVRTAKQLRKAGYLLVGYPGLDNPETCKKLREYFLAQPLSFLHLPERVVRRMNLACGKEVCLNYFVKHPVKDWFAIIQNFDDCLEIAKRLKNLHIRLKDATNLKHGEDMFLRKNTILYSSIEDLPISKKITQALIEKDITSVEQLVGFSSVQIKDQQILGDTSIESIRKALHEGGLLLKDDFVMRCETCEERFVSDDIERVLCDDCIAKKKRLSKNSKIEIAITGPEYGIYSNTPHGFTLWANIKNISSDLLNIRLADFYLVEDEKQISPSYFLTGYSFDEELIMPGTLKSVGKIWDTARFKFSSFLTDDTYAVFVIKITSESHKRLYKFVYKDETWIMDDYYTGKDIGR